MTLEILSETAARWVELYSDSLYSWAFRKTTNKETAEDLVQETFLAAIKSFDKFKGESNPKTWLFGILNHKINDYYRKSYQLPVTQNDAILDHMFDTAEHWRIDTEPCDWPAETENLLDNLDFNEELEKCFQRLPPNWFSSIQLKFMDEKKGVEICQELGITNTNFWQILHRAKLQLRKCLEINWFQK